MSRSEQVEGRKRVAARVEERQRVISDSIIKTQNPGLPLMAIYALLPNLKLIYA